jgi:peptidoglycan/xylan/chitin deacetylase (PgdA/CDA1 family)
MLDIPSVREYLEKKLICRVDTADKVLALTFDDGPNPRNTPPLVEMLEKKGLQATFFVVGRRVRRFRDLLKLTVDGGHEIGNHGDHHVPLSFLPRPIIRRELKVCGDLVAGVTGTQPRFMRPPLGWFNDKVLEVSREMGYEPVIGSIHPQDSRQPGLETILRRVRRRIEPGAVIILHDGGWRIGVSREQTLQAVDTLTDELLEDGYRFVTLSEMMESSYPDRTANEPV